MDRYYANMTKMRWKLWCVRFDTRREILCGEFEGNGQWKGISFRVVEMCEMCVKPT